MHSKSVDSLSLTRAGFIEYFLVATKLVHALTAIAPALFLLYYPGLVPVELRSNMLGLLLFFGALTVIMFQALDVYSDDIFSNRLRFRIMFFAWASAFCLLLFMYQGLGLFPYLSSKLVIFWFTGSLLLFGVQRLLVLRLYRAWMKRGMYLQRTVILGFTESGMHLAEYLVRNHDIRSGIIGFIDDRSERVPENYNSLPLLGNTKDLEKLIRQEQVDQVLVALPWFAEGRIGTIATYHPYTQLPEGNYPWNLDFVSHANQINRALRNAGVPAIWSTEWGWSAYKGPKELQDIIGVEGQADYVLRRLALMSALDYDRIFLFTLSDLDQRASVRDRDYGLLDLDANPKPVYLALQRFLKVTGPKLRPADPPITEDLPDGSFSIGWTREDGRNVWLFWSARGGNVRLPKLKEATLHDPLSGKVTPLSGSDGLEVPVKSSLQMLVWE
ncbi:hypothetical protein RZ910_005807 [Pseudomonas aeruginosa]|nr:hypothetical protein [Pseudomonas aeruginosa]